MYLPLFLIGRNSSSVVWEKGIVSVPSIPIFQIYMITKKVSVANTGNQSKHKDEYH